MFNTRNIPTKGKYGDKEYDIPAYDNHVDKIFKMWVELSQDDKLRLSEKKIKWHNQQLEKK